MRAFRQPLDGPALGQALAYLFEQAGKPVRRGAEFEQFKIAIARPAAGDKPPSGGPHSWPALRRVFGDECQREVDAGVNAAEFLFALAGCRFDRPPRGLWESAGQSLLPGANGRGRQAIEKSGAGQNERTRTNAT